jgi:hypothetical protein
MTAEGAHLATYGYTVGHAYDDEEGWQATSGTARTGGSGNDHFDWSASGSYTRNLVGGSVSGTWRSGGLDDASYRYGTTSTLTAGAWVTIGSGASAGHGRSTSAYQGSGSYLTMVGGILGSRVTVSGSGEHEAYYDYEAGQSYDDTNGWRVTSGAASVGGQGRDQGNWSVAAPDMGSFYSRGSGDPQSSGSSEQSYNYRLSSSVIAPDVWRTIGAGTTVERRATQAGANASSTQKTTDYAYDDGSGWRVVAQQTSSSSNTSGALQSGPGAGGQTSGGQTSGGQTSGGQTSGGQTSAGVIDPQLNYGPLGEPGERAFRAAMALVRHAWFEESDPKDWGGVIRYLGNDVIRILKIEDVELFDDGCQGLNSIRLGHTGRPWALPGTRAFKTWEGAVDAQKDMLPRYHDGYRIVITAMQPQYLDDQLVPYLMPGSSVEYDMNKIPRVQVRDDVLGRQKGKYDVWDFATVFQNDDLSVRFYEDMPYGRRENKRLVVIHKSNLYGPDIAGTVFFVSPIVDHPRAPASPRGTLIIFPMPKCVELR